MRTENYFPIKLQTACLFCEIVQLYLWPPPTLTPHSQVFVIIKHNEGTIHISTVMHIWNTIIILLWRPPLLR